MKIIDAVNQKKTGLYYGNRLILPIHANFLKIVIEKDVITDFSNNVDSGVLIEEKNGFTDIYFIEYKNLQYDVGVHKGIKILCVEKEDNIFDASTHKRLAVYLRDNHIAEIEELNQEILFID